MAHEQVVIDGKNAMLLTTPLDEADMRALNIGDVVYLTGELVTGRDDVHLRHLEHHRELPISLAGKALFHAGPIMRPIGVTGNIELTEDMDYEVVSVGPTTSMRMEKLEKEFIASTGLRLVVGKGGMGPKTATGCREYGAAHAIFPGGCAVIAADCVKKVRAVHWLDLGMPEALWELEVEMFGPLLISIDAKGQNFIDQNKQVFQARADREKSKIHQNVKYIQ